LANHVVVADDQLAVLATILEILRHRADRGELKDAVVAADGRVAVNDRVRADRGAAADAHLRPDDGVGRDLDVRVELGARCDVGGRVDPLRAHSFTRRVSVSVNPASAVTWPSTRATHRIFHIGRRRLTSVASSTSWSPGNTGRRKRALSTPVRTTT